MTVRPGWHPVIGDPPPPVSSFAFRLAAVASSTVISSVVGQRHRFLLFVRRFDYSNRFRAPFLPHVSFRSPDGCVYNITPEYITYHFFLQRDFWKIIILRITWYENITSNSPYNRSDFYYYQFSYVTFGWSELTIIVHWWWQIALLKSSALLQLSRCDDNCIFIVLFVARCVWRWLTKYWNNKVYEEIETFMQGKISIFLKQLPMMIDAVKNKAIRK